MVLSSVPLDPTLVNASGLTPRNPPALQDGLRSELQPDVAISAHCQRFLDVGYVASLSRNLETFVGTNLQSVLLPPGTDPQPYVPFPDFARGSAFADTIGNEITTRCSPSINGASRNGLTGPRVVHLFQDTD